MPKQTTPKCKSGTASSTQPPAGVGSGFFNLSKVKTMTINFSELSTATLEQINEELAAGGFPSGKTDIEDARKSLWGAWKQICEPAPIEEVASNGN